MSPHIYLFYFLPCDIEDLPPVTAVVISHNHYDHLEWDAVVKLNHFHKDIRWFVPKGLKDWFIKTDCKNVIELAWWEESVMNLNDKDDTKVICVPAQHWSQRKLHDAMTVLVVSSSDLRKQCTISWCLLIVPC
jgi:L-ascorbate metabolism protein UlaG (beta-lactamase superfamily)